MTPDRYARIYAIFEAAWPLDADARHAFLSEACGGDAELLREVEALLDQRSDGDDSLADVSFNGRSDVRPGTIVAGKYRIEQKIGEGGMGTVYRAVHLALDRAVAIKLLAHGTASPTATIERFKREALAVARLRHRNIVEIYDFGETPDLGAFLVMEHLDGRSLAEEISRRGVFPTDDALPFMRTLCRAVHAAHEAGVVHRDLKPQNVFIDERPTGSVVKVLDFGIAKLRESWGSAAGRTTGGLILGTPVYMSPEQGLGRPVDARADVYALGCILYEMLTARPPILAPSAIELLVKKARDLPLAPSSRVEGISPAVDDVVMRALAIEPEKRWPTALAFAEALESAVSGVWAGLSTTAIYAVEHPPADVTNLPHDLSSFVGRRAEIDALTARLAGERLVTLTGPGGIGKTRLAIEVARAALGRFPDGVWFVDLTGVTDANTVASAVAHALRVEEQRGLGLRASLRAGLGGRRTAVVLDNCEQVIEGCAALARELLEAAPGLHILATSREPLDLPGEAVWRLAPLGLPPEDAVGEAASESASVLLFLERVRLARPDFGQSPEQLREVAALCRDLEGIPLAIELAAARSRSMAIPEIRRRMGDRLRLLGGGHRSGPERHRTLRATIDWSYELLVDDERALLRRLSVFAGTFALDAVERACCGDGIDEMAVIDLLARLSDKSLVEPAAGDARESRFSMLESVRQYAREKLDEAGETEARHEAHFIWCADLASRTEEAIYAARQGTAVESLKREWENVRAAAEWALRRGTDVDTSLAFFAALGSFSGVGGYRTEVRVWLQKALALDPTAVTAARVAALHAYVNTLMRDAAPVPAMKAAEECVRACRLLGDDRALALNLSVKAKLHTFLSDFDEAAPLHDEAMALARKVGDPKTTSAVLMHSAHHALEIGQLERATPILRECVEQFLEVDNALWAAVCLDHLSECLRQRGDLRGALAAVERFETIGRGVELGHVFGHVYLGKAQILSELGNAETSRENFRLAAEFYRNRTKPESMIDTLETYALALARWGEGEAAVTLVASADAGRKVIEIVRPPRIQVEIDAALAPTIERIDAAEVAQLRDQGARMSVDAALAWAFPAPAPTD